jgi:H+/Cl- antiporter ClcA
LSKLPTYYRHTFPAVEEEISKDIKRLFVTLGGAAGIAAAFKAPVGGVLYMFEELASFWSPETTFRAFVCTTVAAISLSAMLSRGNAVETDRVVRSSLFAFKLLVMECR